MSNDLQDFPTTGKGMDLLKIISGGHSRVCQGEKSSARLDSLNSPDGVHKP